MFKVAVNRTLPKKNATNSFESNLNVNNNLFYFGRITETIVNTSTFTFGHVYIGLILLPCKQWKIGSIEYKTYDVLFDRTFVRNIFHTSKYLASYAENTSSNAHTFSCRSPLFSAKCNRNLNKRNNYFSEISLYLVI